MKRKSSRLAFFMAFLLAMILVIPSESLAAAFPNSLPEKYHAVLKSYIVDNLSLNPPSDVERLSAEYRVGNYIPLYTWDGEKIVKVVDQIYYPVYAGKTLADIYILANPPVEPALSQGPGYLISSLDNYIKFVSPEYCLITYLGKTYAVSKGKIQLLADIGTMGFDLKSMKEQIDGMKDSQLKTDYEAFYNQVKEKNPSEFSSEEIKKEAQNFTKEFLEEKLQESNFDFSTNQDMTNFSNLPVIYKGGTSKNSFANKSSVKSEKKSQTKAPPTGDPFFARLFPAFFPLSR